MLLKKFNQNSFIYKEAIGGITTFLTMSYIIFVNADILSQTGLNKESLITVTALSCFLATFLSSIYCKNPICYAPGMGLNAIFAFTIVGTTGLNAFNALAIVFTSSVIFLILSISGFCSKLAKIIPDELKSAISIGIGLFLMVIGFGELKINNIINLDLSNPEHIKTIIGITTLMLTLILIKLKINAGILIGILLATYSSAKLNLIELPSNLISFPPANIKETFLKYDFSNIFSMSSIKFIISLLVIEILGITGTIISCSNALNTKIPEGKKLNKIYTTDAIASIIGSTLGTSTVTGYIESASGISAGARKGLSSLICAILFLISIIFIPFISIVPSYATAPALITVGFLMLKDITKLLKSKYYIVFSCLLTIVGIPYFMDFGKGMILGIVSYFILHSILPKVKK